ncbi:MAG: hypothetical protein IJC26_03205 [Clostridia bacterium]|nr:hypothetical protein [Clostridia bacterium]
MKRMTLKKLLPQQKTLRYLLSTLLLTVGVYLAYPIRGIVATFPLCFFFSVIAYFFTDRLWIHLTTAGGIAFFYSMMTDFYDPFSFALYVVASALLAAFALRLLRAFPKKKKLLIFLGLVLLIAVSALLSTVFCGSPSSFRKAEKDTADYLSYTYPEQKFEEVTVYYNLRNRCYAAEVDYLFEGNMLTSTVLFTEDVRDGFLDDFVSWMQEKRKSLLIDVVKTGTEDVVITSSGLTEKTSDGVFHGSYGSLGAEMEPLFHFTATFREEKPERRGFAEACKNVMSVLKENGFDYGSITFYALDAGNVVYQCTITPETDPELVLSLVKYAE